MMRGFYEGAQNSACKIGAEVEYALCRQLDLTAPSLLENKALFSGLEHKGWGARREPPTNAIELATPPFEISNIRDLLSHVNQGTSALYAAALEQGLIVSPFGHLPHTALTDLEVIDLDRYQAFWENVRGDMVECARFFMSCMNIQVSLGYKDPDHLLRIIRMATALEPVMFLTTDSSCGFNEGRPIRHVQNIAQKNKMGVNTGIPDFYYTARSGAQLVDAHIDFTLNNPHVFTAFNDAGALVRFPEGRWCSFNQLEALGLGPQNLTNYLQAQSESWRRACNIAVITDEDGNLTNHRAEIAAFQNGLLHQRASAIILGYLIGFDDQFYEDTQKLLHGAGIDLDALDESKPVLEANFDAACYHDNRYHEVSFGTATMKDFVLPFADVIEAAAARHGLGADIQPAVHIMRSGRPDWLVYRQALPTLDETLDYLRSFPALVQDNPALLDAGRCADQLFKSASTQSKSLRSKCS